MANEAKTDALGMPFGTASARLRKSLLYSLAGRLGLLDCHQCGEHIEQDDLSIEHVTAWLHADDPVDAFFDLDNIAFSHLGCNIRAERLGKRQQEHGITRYKRGCRCDTCRAAKAERWAQYQPLRPAR